MGYIFPLLVLILDVLLIIKIVKSDEPAKLAWILVILLLPVLGPLIYIGLRTRNEPLWRHNRSRSA